MTLLLFKCAPVRAHSRPRHTRTSSAGSPTTTKPHVCTAASAFYRNSRGQTLYAHRIALRQQKKMATPAFSFRKPCQPLLTACAGYQGTAASGFARGSWYEHPPTQKQRLVNRTNQQSHAASSYVETLFSTHICISHMHVSCNSTLVQASNILLKTRQKQVSKMLTGALLRVLQPRR